MTRLWRWTRYFTAHGRFIPRDARVDPRRFSEERFPVVCAQCGYLLRGLPDARCPECGTGYDHGRLLVEQYVIEAGARHSAPLNGAARWCAIVGIALLAVSLAVIDLMPVVVAHLTQGGTSAVLLGARAAKALPVLAVILLLASVALLTVMTVRNGRRAQQVLEAIDPETLGRHDN